MKVSITYKNKKKDKDYEISSGNVFRDLDFKDFEERLAKAELAGQINIIIEQKNLSHLEIAKLFDIYQSKISDLNKGKLASFSLEELSEFLENIK